MFAIKKANVMCNFTSRLTSIRPKFYARKFATTTDNQTIIKNDFKSSQPEISQQNHTTPVFTLYMEPELKQKGALYEQVYHDVARELTDFRKYSLQPNKHGVGSDHYLKMLDYTLADGQRLFFNLVAELYLDLMANKGITTEHIKQAYQLGWGMEMLLYTYLIVDDINDDSEVRRGKVCWHKVKGVERVYMNDVLLLEGGCYLILSRYFSHLPCYAGMIKTVTESFMISMMGHALESHYNNMGLEHFTIEMFNYVSIMKGAYYTFCMPSTLAMLLAGYDLDADKKVFDDMKEITQVIGPWFQAQNDYLDYFVDQKSKPGHDIENGKFSWFAAMVMENGSEYQKDVMRKNYGKYDADCVAKVKQVYEDLHLREVYFDYKKRNHQEVMQRINESMQSDEILRNACLKYFDMVYDK